MHTKHTKLFATSPIPTIKIPTFFYKHEPPNTFTSLHTKYFTNYIHEKKLVNLTTHNIIFAPNNANTIQEIFQNTYQNHYNTMKNLISPITLYNSQYWTKTLPILPLLRALSLFRHRTSVFMVVESARYGLIGSMCCRTIMRCG
jgi:hypothetical protein